MYIYVCVWTSVPFGYAALIYGDIKMQVYIVFGSRSPKAVLASNI